MGACVLHSDSSTFVQEGSTHLAILCVEAFLEQSVIWNALADGGKAVALIEALVVAFDQNVNWNVFAPIVGLLTDYV